VNCKKILERGQSRAAGSGKNIWVLHNGSMPNGTCLVGRKLKICGDKTHHYKNIKYLFFS